MHTCRCCRAKCKAVHSVSFFGTLADVVVPYVGFAQNFGAITSTATASVVKCEAGAS